MKKVVLLSALVMLVAIPTFAENPPNYAALKLGAYLPQASDVDEFDTSFYGEVAFGHYVHPNFALELGFGWTESSASVSDPFIGSVDADLTIIPITLGIKAGFQSGNFEPFATAGIGLYLSDFDATVSMAGVGSISGSDDDTAVGGFLGLGADLNVTPNIFVGFEGKYFFATPSFEGVDFDIHGINLTANIGYRF